MNTIQYCSDQYRNALLAAFPAATLSRWQSRVRSVELSCGQPLSGSFLSRQVIFPTTAIVSLVCTTADGGSAEVGVVGNDGVVGISQILGRTGTANQFVVQNAGHGYLLPTTEVTGELADGGPVQTLLLDYSQALFAQVAQTALCNRYHSIEQQLARRLLVGLDRSGSDQLTMTHESMARLLGVRREGVSAAAFRMQQAGVIRYSRGRLVVHDREELEHRACECYAVAMAEHAPVFPSVVGASARGRSAVTVDRAMRVDHPGDSVVAAC
jgi:hypothetical protein